jgi:hypothetical protein
VKNLENPKYIVPDREWVKIEIKLRDALGEKWFLENPPRGWAVRPRSNLIIYRMALELKDFGFREGRYFANRVPKDLISFKYRYIIHSKPPSERDRKLMRALNYSYWTFSFKNWRQDLDQIFPAIVFEKTLNEINIEKGDL